jgi:hypothetical protein
MRIMLAAATVAALAGGGALSVMAARNAPALQRLADQDEDAAQSPRRIVIGLDLSRSNPLIENPDFAAKVARRIAGEVSDLGFASEVHVRTFGNFDTSSNTFAYDAVISRRARPEKVAAEIEKLVSSVPDLVERGKWRAQNATNIVGFLDNAVEAIGCDDLPTIVILASDGVEDSEYARLKFEDARLPDPQDHPFRGCAELQILGIGQGTRSPSQTLRLKAMWGRWAKAAGFARFVGLNDW